jgi:glycine/serine hydroxymethyltransferase
MVSAGMRIGSPTLAARGFGSADFAEVADTLRLSTTSPR